MAIVNRRNLIITDLPDVIGDMLRQMGRRHTTKLSR
jgi:glycerophosphoryl diester phosphodiesterase